MTQKMGFAEGYIKIKVEYRGKWYYASDISIDEDGSIDVEYCHGLQGCVDNEHVTEIKIENAKKTS